MCPSQLSRSTLHEQFQFFQSVFPSHKFASLWCGTKRARVLGVGGRFVSETEDKVVKNLNIKVAKDVPVSGDRE